MVTARNGHLGTVQILITRGADINKKDKNGWTPLRRLTLSL